jgi:hypothetical protein
MLDHLGEVGCLLIPPGSSVNYVIVEVDCGDLYDILGINRISLYGDPDIDRRHARSNAHASARPETRRGISVEGRG